MADETKTETQQTERPKPTRGDLAKMFYDCKTQEELNGLALKFPEVKSIFSAVHFSS